MNFDGNFSERMRAVSVVFGRPASGDRLLSGRVFDYAGTSVLASDNQALLARRDVLIDMIEDDIPLPTTDAREGYFGDRHLEYWLSGYRDAQKAIMACDLNALSKPRILDFGGASGRVTRHVVKSFPSGELYLSDINPNHISLAREMFGERVTAVRNYSTPHLPFTDGYFDCVFAFSVFTHMDSEDIGWLYEFLRIIKPGGCIYITVHDDATWRQLPDTFLGSVCLHDAEFSAYHAQNKSLKAKVVHYYNNLNDYNCNVFLPNSYLEKHWFPLFDSATVLPLAHDHQSAVVLKLKV